MNKFKDSKHEAYLICNDCGQAIAPMAKDINKHLEECGRKKK